MAKKPKWLLDIPASTYHKEKKYLTSHRLGSFRKCPLLYRKDMMGLIPERDSKAYMVGSAIHTLFLEGPEAFDRSYVVGGPINPKTNAPYGRGTKAFDDWMVEKGNPNVLTESEASIVEAMNLSLLTHPQTHKIVSGNGFPETTIRQKYSGVFCQIRPDWIDIDGENFVDLKSCADLTWFEHDAKRFDYIYQMAFYQAIIDAVSGKNFKVHLVAVEKQEPFRVGVWVVDPEALKMAKRHNEEAIARLIECREIDVWPSLTEDIKWFNPFN